MEDNSITQDPLLTATPADITPVETPSLETPAELITNKHVLASQGLVEITNADGSKSQVSKETALAMIANAQKLATELGVPNE